MEIWILNHYATMMGKDGIGRHHSFAKYLTLQGHSVKLFCANTVHNSSKQINLGNKLYKKIKEKDDILSDGRMWEVLTARYFSAICLPDCTVMHVTA